MEDRSSETCPISMCDRMARIEDRVKICKEATPTTRCKVEELGQDLKKIRGQYFAEDSEATPSAAKSTEAGTYNRLPRSKFSFTAILDDACSFNAFCDIQRAGPLGSRVHVPKKPRRRRRKQEDNSTLKGAPEPVRDIFVYRLAKTTPVDKVKEYMEINNMDLVSIEQVSKSEAKFASFKAQIRVSHLPYALDQDSWSKNMCAAAAAAE
ncbi:hypothetical protein CAPTEDRAFT_206188 [Capitella teleta]|uniref:Uncharacterized protein n=1 Tax=Capitella teleta TaxID=283909 RepID=R7UG12_CAPTE|nr:hypothetical protein CAPTEDRAFT_206188 [Capitella teleta]|eukprot:ELU05028.1 hypothetical protein CAPTEDRAFT_206188 [Capitella teleta]